MINPKEPEASDSSEDEVLQSKIFDHLGLVAGMFEELEIGDRIDEQIAQDFEERNVSVGQAVKALVLTGLGFVQQRLYLTAQFFEKMPTDRLIGEEVRPEHLNDDVLGRALDDLYDYGVTELFRDLAAHAAEKLGLTSRFAHLDATSFSFEGEYDSDEPSEDGVIRIQQGYSRDNRPDLNQAVLDMIVERKAGLPVLMEPLSGNVSDPGSFPDLIDRHVDHLLWRPTDSTTWWPTVPSTALTTSRSLPRAASSSSPVSLRRFQRRRRGSRRRRLSRWSL
jgi:transposase